MFDSIYSLVTEWLSITIAALIFSPLLLPIVVLQPVMSLFGLATLVFVLKKEFVYAAITYSFGIAFYSLKGFIYDTSTDPSADGLRLLFMPYVVFFTLLATFLLYKKYKVKTRP